MTDTSDEDPGAVAAYDQFLADAKDAHPGQTLEWYHAWMIRMVHYQKHDGDMTGAPDMPPETPAPPNPNPLPPAPNPYPRDDD